MNTSMTQSETKAPKAITQEQLARFYELAPLKDEFDALRERLLRALEAGASVEEGGLVVDYHTINQQRLTPPKLIADLGLTKAEVEVMRMAVSPTRCRHLSVHDRSSPFGQALLAAAHSAEKKSSQVKVLPAIS